MDPDRTRAARDAAEIALVRVAHHYGGTPEFIVIGGLVPELLTRQAGVIHQGTTDIDVQVDLEIQHGGTNSPRLEQALRNAEFGPSGDGGWRWTTLINDRPVEVKFELLADQGDVATSTVVAFTDAEDLEAMNLHGTGYARLDATVRSFTRRVGDQPRTVNLRVTGPVGLISSKAAAYAGRHKAKDLYDIAFVGINNDDQTPGDEMGERIGSAIRQAHGGRMPLAAERAFRELGAAFTSVADAGPQQYSQQFHLDNPGGDVQEHAAIAVAVISDMVGAILD